MEKVERFRIRPATEGEKPYTYQPCSEQLRQKTGMIGEISGWFGKDETRFTFGWMDADPKLNRNEYRSDEVKKEIGQLVDWLRSGENEDGFLGSLPRMDAYCSSHDEALFRGAEGEWYGFRIDSERRVYLLSAAHQGEWNCLRCCCYVKEIMDMHLAGAERGIRFVDPVFNDLFRIRDGEKIRIVFADGRKEEHTCRYIDPYHFEIDRCPKSSYQIGEFAALIERWEARIEKSDMASLPVDDMEETVINMDEIFTYADGCIHSEPKLEKAVKALDYSLGGQKYLLGVVNDLYVECLVNPGASEGVYVDCFLRSVSEGKRTHLGTYKTLDEGIDAFILMGEIAGAFTCFAEQKLYHRERRFASLAE